MSGVSETSASSTDALKARVAALEQELAATKSERDKLREAYRTVQLELELLKRRLYVAKAERVDVSQLELEFAQKLAELDALSKRLEPLPPTLVQTSGGGTGGTTPARKPTGRRELKDAPIPEERLELLDDTLEGKAQRIGFEESSKLIWRRGGFARLVVARAKYQVPQPVAGDASPTTVSTTSLPPELFPRLLAGPSLLARIAVDKHCDGLPLHRQELRAEREGVPLDRGTMSRWLEDIGNTLGSTLIAAAREHFFAHAFCISTDATGVSVQPLKGDWKKRQPCRKGHFFVQLADKDFAFFEYVPRETSAAVSQLFKGFNGYVQADAKSVYDELFSPPEPRARDGDDEDDERAEVGCWCHARRKYWEAAAAHCTVSREALFRIHRIFENEEKWKDLPPDAIKALRDERTRPLLDSFFPWVEAEYAKVKDQRGFLRSALGYCVRQRAALCRFLEDGRLKLDNNASERELKRIATGRKAWLFVGSDDHAHAAAALFSLIATCKLHRLEPEQYLRDVLRVLAHWPRERYLELCPHRWLATRASLDAGQLAAEFGPLTVPPPVS